MRATECVVHPMALPAHDWRIAGIDVKRGYAEVDVSAVFSGAAAPPAKAR